MTDACHEVSSAAAATRQSSGASGSGRVRESGGAVEREQVSTVVTVKTVFGRPRRPSAVRAVPRRRRRLGVFFCTRPTANFRRKHRKMKKL